MTRVTEDGNTLRMECDTWGDFLTAAMASGNKGDSSRSGSSTFTGTRSWADAVTLAKKGWAEGAANIAEISASLNENIGQKTYYSETLYDVAGDWTDIGRYLEGDPECCARFETLPKDECGKVVRIAVNMSASCGVKTEVIEVRGAAVCSLVDALERVGYRCEVVLCHAVTTTSGGLRTETAVTVKRDDEPLEMDQMAMALAHPSTLRRLMFSVQEHTPDRWWQFLRGNYGMPADSEHEQTADIALGKAHYSDKRWHTLAAAQAWVDEVLAQYVKTE